MGATIHSKLFDSFTNPVRCSIMLVVQSHGTCTAKQLQQELPEIKQATLYRHLGSMCEDGVLKIASQRKVRAVVERSYAIAFDLNQDIQRMILENDGEAYAALFWQFVSGLIGEFRAYARRQGINILKDGSGFTARPVYATLEELEGAIKNASTALAALQDPTRPPDPRRKRHTIALITTPPNNDD